MDFLSLSDVLAKVAEDDISKAAKKVEEERQAWKALRVQSGRSGLTAGELVERMSMDDDEHQATQEILSLPQKEKKDAPKPQRSGFFGRPPGSQ